MVAGTPRNERGHLVKDRRNLTNEHRRCNRCLVWKVHSEFPKNHAFCRDCKNAANRQRYARLPEKELEAYLKKQHKAQNRRTRKKTRRRLRDAHFLVSTLLRNGITKKEIKEETNIDARTLRYILSGRTKVVRDATLERLYDMTLRRIA